VHQRKKETGKGDGTESGGVTPKRGVPEHQSTGNMAGTDLVGKCREHDLGLKKIREDKDPPRRIQTQRGTKKKGEEN